MCGLHKVGSNQVCGITSTLCNSEKGWILWMKALCCSTTRAYCTKCEICMKNFRTKKGIRRKKVYKLLEVVKAKLNKLLCDKYKFLRERWFFSPFLLCWYNRELKRKFHFKWNILYLFSLTWVEYIKFRTCFKVRFKFQCFRIYPETAEIAYYFANSKLHSLSFSNSLKNLIGHNNVVNAIFKIRNSLQEFFHSRICFVYYLAILLNNLINDKL